MLSAESSLLIRRITAGPAGRRPATRPSKKLETAPFETAVAMSGPTRDRKSTRLNSSHDQISYAVFCLKKKNQRGGDRGRRLKPRGDDHVALRDCLEHPAPHPTVARSKLRDPVAADDPHGAPRCSDAAQRSQP